MLLVLIALAVLAVVLITDHYYEEQQQFNYNDWLRMKYQPGWSREKQFEQDLQEYMQEDIKQGWKKHL